MVRSRLLILIVMALTVFSLSSRLAAAQAEDSSGRTFYIDSQNGNDLNDGLSEASPWKSHTIVSSVALLPGDTIAFKRGSAFSGPLFIRDSGAEDQPITLTAYGDGPAPRFTNPNDRDMNGNAIRIAGSWIIVENLHFHDTPPTRLSGRPQSIFRMGAIYNMAGANHNIIRDNVFINCTKAIQSAGEFTLITNNLMDGPDHPMWTGEAALHGWGPIAIQLGIGNQEISYNTIKNYLTTDSPYGSDGGAIELDDGRYHKDNIYIHHNYTEGNAGFLESSWELDYLPMEQEVHNLRVAFNVSYDGQGWILMWAPCHDCYFDNNTVIRTRDFGSPSNDVAYLAFPGIHFRNNLFVYTSVPYHGAGAAGIVTEGNWYFDVDDPTGHYRDDNQAGSGDPALIDLSGGDFRLTCGSPARKQGVNLIGHYALDFEGRTLLEQGSWDVGAYQATDCND